MAAAAGRICEGLVPLILQLVRNAEGNDPKRNRHPPIGLELTEVGIDLALNLHEDGDTECESADNSPDKYLVQFHLQAMKSVVPPRGYPCFTLGSSHASSWRVA